MPWATADALLQAWTRSCEAKTYTTRHYARNNTTGCTFVGCSPSLYYPFPYATLASNMPSHTAMPYIILPIRHSRQQYAFIHCPALHYPSPTRHSRQQYALTHCPALHYYWCPVKPFRGALFIVNRLNYCELQTYFIINTPVYTNTAGAAQNKHKLILRRDTSGRAVIAYMHKKSLPPEGERRIVRNPLIQITL